MKIKSDIKHKSLSPFLWQDVPSFAIITGLNGAGKSQLLELLRTKPEIIDNEEEPKYTRNDVTIWNSSGGQIPSTTNKFHLRNLIAIALYLKESYDPIRKILGTTLPRINNPILNEDNRVSQLNTLTGVNFSGKEIEIVSIIQEKTGKPFVDLSLLEIMYHFPEQIFVDTTNLSSDRLELVFFMYHFRRSMDEKAGKDFTNYPEAPWSLLNQVFAISKLPYEIDNPSNIHIDFDPLELNKYAERNNTGAYSLKLTNTDLNITMEFNSLSSGEKVILSLAFMLYYAIKNNYFRKLLLLDEPDAHLHPSLTKQFLEVVETFLVKKFGAKVIMTTHSPSTIGLCNEESIFVMSKNPTTILKQPRSIAVNYLTSGVPVLNSIIDNRRYIIVEDKNDSTFYTTIYNLISKRITPKFHLFYLSSSPKPKAGEIL